MATEGATSARDDLHMMTLRFRDETRVPALAIAAYVSEHGAVYSAEILDRFQLSASTLRRRRPELRRLGLLFVERGRGSFYVAPQLVEFLSASYRSNDVFSLRERGPLTDKPFLTSSGGNASEAECRGKRSSGFINRHASLSGF